MKSIVALAVIAVSVAVSALPVLPPTKSSTKSPAAYDVELDKKINQVWTDCEAIHAGMTARRPAMFRRETGGVAVPESTAAGVPQAPVLRLPAVQFDYDRR